MMDAQKPRYSEAGTIVYLTICKLTLHKRQHVACTETFTCYLIFCATEMLHVVKLLLSFLLAQLKHPVVAVD
jgi:hypothetical protein